MGGGIIFHSKTNQNIRFKKKKNLIRLSTTKAMGRLLTIFLFSFIFLLLPFFGEAEDGFLEFYLGLSNDRINPKIIGGTSSSTGFELEYAPIELKRKGPTPVEATGISLNNSLETIDDAIGVVFFSSPVAPINNVGTMEQLITHYGQDSQGKNNPIWNDIFFPNGQFKQKFSIKQMNNFDVSPYVEKRTSSNKQIPVISTQISRMIAETIKSFAKGDINLSLSNVPFDPAKIAATGGAVSSSIVIEVV